VPEAPPDLKIIDPDAELPLACIEVNLALLVVATICAVLIA
jgi:hypothetical protein